MILVENVLGNLKDDQWRDKLADRSIDFVALDQWEAQKKPLQENLE